jgi:1-acyl-sn-glycerol-3-phosphate acyltransferase
MSDVGYRTAWRAFDVVLRPWMRHRVRAVRMAGLPKEVPHDVPLLLCPNHTSWWDGFLARELFRVLRPQAPLFTIMLDEELGLRPFLRPLGAIGIRRDSVASVRGTLRTLAARRALHSELGVILFPQGRIWPSFRRPLGFEPGVRLFHRALAPVRVLPVGIHLEPGVGTAPVAYLSAGELLDPQTMESDALRELEASVEAELDAIHHLLALHGEDEEAAWPTRYASLPRAPVPESAPW